MSEKIRVLLDEETVEKRICEKMCIRDRHRIPHITVILWESISFTAFYM